MKSLFILEHPEHLALIKEWLKTGDILIGFTPAARHELDKNRIKYKIPEDYYSHGDLFLMYRECTANLSDNMTALDNRLWGIDGRFKNLDLRPFFLGIYEFKTLIDNVKIFIYILCRIMRQESPDEVIIVSEKDFAKPHREGLNFAPQDPVCCAILDRLAGLYGFKLTVIPPEGETRYLKENNVYEYLESMSFFNIKNYKLRQGLSGLINAISSMPALLKKEGCRKGRILANSKDLMEIRGGLTEKGYVIESFSELDFCDNAAGKNYEFKNEFVGSLKNDQRIKDLCIFESVEFYSIIEGRISHFTDNLGAFIGRYSKVAGFIKDKAYDAVVLGYLPSHLFINMMITDICKKLRIPCICWMHGGYGTYMSFEGYDMSDLLFATHYFTYGRAVKSAIDKYYPSYTIGDENMSKISSRYPAEKIKIFVAGSAYLENKFRYHQRPANAKKRILFIIGETWVHNMYYMGGNAPYSYFNKYEENKAILRTLIRHQEGYEIIVKSYPYDMIGTSMLRKIVGENNGGNVRVVSNEATLDEIIKQSDLTVSTWVSSSFFEAAFFDCDQFLFDNGDMTEEARAVISDSCFFSDDIKDFCGMLDEYLAQGIFYKKSKDKFRANYLDMNDAEKKTEKIDSYLQEIISGYKQAVQNRGGFSNVYFQ